jgi:hypothetical protein
MAKTLPNESAKLGAFALVPPGVVTIILPRLVVPDGVTAVIEVSFTTTTDVAGKPPIVTPVAPLKPEPVIVIAVPLTLKPVTG